MKYLLVLVVVLVVLWLLGKRVRRRDETPPPPTPGKPDPGTAMVACARCGLHVPEQEALRDTAGRPFCGDEHRRLGIG